MTARDRARARRRARCAPFGASPPERSTGCRSRTSRIGCRPLANARRCSESAPPIQSRSEPPPSAMPSQNASSAPARPRASTARRPSRANPRFSTKAAATSTSRTRRGSRRGTAARPAPSRCRISGRVGGERRRGGFRRACIACGENRWIRLATCASCSSTSNARFTTGDAKTASPRSPLALAARRRAATRRRPRLSKMLDRWPGSDLSSALVQHERRGVVVPAQRAVDEHLPRGRRTDRRRANDRSSSRGSGAGGESCFAAAARKRPAAAARIRGAAPRFFSPKGSFCRRLARYRARRGSIQRMRGRRRAEPRH